MIDLRLGDSIDLLKTLPENSVDSLVTDPPAAISFMGADWDGDRGGRKQWSSWLEGIMRECLRVLKPGAHGLVWSLPKSSHWTGAALEDAGFDIRDVIEHVFSQGMPKGLNVAKTISKKFGDGAAQEFEGLNTQLKPSHESWWLIQKPISEKTIVDNVLKWGTGGLNIAETRVPHNEPESFTKRTKPRKGSSLQFNTGTVTTWENGDYRAAAIEGRFPPNLLLSHSLFCTVAGCDSSCPIAAMDLMSGVSTKETEPKLSKHNKSLGGSGSGIYGNGASFTGLTSFGDSGGASRYYPNFSYSREELEELDHVFGYYPKIATKDRNAGGDNNHPTVKGLELMAWLCKLATPKGGTILDPFMGSGSTGKAAILNGFNFIGFEKYPAYFDIAVKRIKWAKGESGLFALPEGADIASPEL